MLILHHAILLNSLIISSKVLESLGFPYKTSYHLQTKTFIPLPFLFICLLFLFPALFLWLQLPVPCWTGGVRVGIFVLLLILDKTFETVTTEYDVGCRFVTCGITDFIFKFNHQGYYIISKNINFINLYQDNCHL